MKSVFVAFAVLAVILMVGVHTSEALDCYVCNSAGIYEGELCGDPTKFTDEETADIVKNCDEEGARDGLTYTMCRKMVQDVEGDIRTVRTCASTGEAGKCVERKGTAKISAVYCECEGDKCNSARSLLATPFTTVALLITSLLALKVASS